MTVALRVVLSLSFVAAPPRVATVDLPPGITVLREPLVLPTEVDEVVVDGHGRSTLCGGITVEAPRWVEPAPDLLARLPAESRGRARMLILPPDLLAGWKDGLAGPVHFGQGTTPSASAAEVFVGDVALAPARWPNEGWATIGRVVDPGSVQREAGAGPPEGPGAAAPPHGAVFVPTDPSHLARWGGPDVWLHGFWNWDWSDEQLPLAGIDAAAGTVTLGRPHVYGVAQRGRFRVTNALGELDAPGESWLDREGGRLVAWLPDGAERDAVTVSMLAAPLVVLPGGAHAPRVRIVGVAFRCTRGSAIVGRDVHGAVIERCDIRWTGAGAIAISGTACRIDRCLLSDIGGTGVTLAGGDRSKLIPADNVVADCRLLRCGRLQRTYHPAIDVAGVGQRILHNEIAELPHTAILFAGNDHLIEANHIHHVLLETGDAGAVYSGRDWTSQGNVIRGNLVHDIEGSDARYQNAFYLDDMASGITVESNVVVRCNWGVLVGGGRDDTIRGNAFVACRKAISYDARGVGWMAKAIADPSRSTLHARLAAVPVDAEPWRTRFPALGAYLTDRFGRPVGGRVVDTTLVATPLGRIEDRECVEESGTVTLEAPAAEALDSFCRDLIRSIENGPVTIGRTTAGPVGPRRE